MIKEPQSTQNSLRPVLARAVLKPILGLLLATHLFPNLIVGFATLVFGLVAARGQPDLTLLARVWGVVMCGHASIGLTNDYLDQQRDELAQPDKPIPSGLVPAWLVLIVILSLLSLGVLLDLTLPVGAALLALVATASGLLYDFLLKDSYLSWVPYLLSFSILPLFVWAGLNHFSAALIWIFPPALLLTVGINLANALPDVESDINRHASQGLAHRLGTRRTLLACRWLFGFAPGLCILLSLFLPVNRVWCWLGCGLALLTVVFMIWSYQASAKATTDLDRVWKLCCIATFFTAAGWLAALTLI